MSAAQGPSPRWSPWQVMSSVARVGRLARKELVEILCDRRTILTLLLMPLLLYTLLSFAFRQFLMVFATSNESRKELVIGVATEEQKIFVEAYLAYGAEVQPWRAAAVVGLEAPLAMPAPFQAGAGSLARKFYQEPQIVLPGYHPSSYNRVIHPPVVVEVVAHPRKALSRGDIDLAVQMDLFPSAAFLLASTIGMGASPPSEAALLAATRNVIRPSHPLSILIAGNHPLILTWDVRYLEQVPRSRYLATYLEEHCALANARQMQGLLARRGFEFPVVPVQLARTGIPAGEPLPWLSLSALVPLILILMTITGAVYPAIDLTAGERERGTLEILVAAPVPRLALLFAKYTAVVAVAMLTAIVNLAMMLVTLELNGLTKEVFRQSGLTVQVVVELLLLLILFAAFFSAVLLALTSFARSFKEAQAYLVPLMLVSLVPGVLGMMPGLKLQGILAVTPLVNIVLLARDLAERTASVGVAAVVVVSTLMYAVAAITVAARIFGAEAVLFSEQSGWSDLFRRPARTQPTATVSGALCCLALLLPASFVADSVLARMTMESRLVFQIAGTVLLFVGLPLLACLASRIRITSAFQMLLPSWAAVIAGLCLAIAAVPIMYLIMALMQKWQLVLINAQMEQNLRALLPWGRATSPSYWVMMATFALVGITEEIFFRGFLFSALRARTSQRVTILTTALLFGLFHFVSLFDRLIPTTLMGLLLGWVCWRTRSVLPGMLLHGCYNALTILLLHFQVESGALDDFTGIFLWWQIVALPIAAMGVWLLWRIPAPQSKALDETAPFVEPESMDGQLSRSGASEVASVPTTARPPHG